MILSNEDIKRALKNGEIKISPPPKEEQIGGASIDLTLSNEFWKFKCAYIGKKVDLKKTSFKEATVRILSERIELKPGEMLLGKTVEQITLPPYILGRLEGRSRYARMGLAVHVTSSLIQPGSDNRQVLEIVNTAPFTIVLHAGMRISQVVFEKLETKSSKPYAKFGKIARKQ